MRIRVNRIKPKEELIKKEAKRLLKIFEKIDENKLKTVVKLIDTAAFLSVSMAELERKINEAGYVEEYQNGENQRGKKKTPEVEIHIALTKNYTAIISRLAEITPPSHTDDNIAARLMEGD